MSLKPEDPKLSAWLLGELSDEEAAEVERAVAVDPALQMAVRDIERVQRALANALSPEAAVLFPRQRSAILLEARRMDIAKPGIAPTASKAKISWFFPAAAAAVLALACWLLVLLPKQNEGDLAGNGQKGKPDSAADDRATWPAPSPADAGPVQPATQTGALDLRFPVLIPRQSVATADQPVLPLPIQAGDQSLNWVKRSIREEKRLPSVHAVRLEEIINQFPFRPAGISAVTQGVSLSAEATACPWRSDSRLLVLSWRAAKHQACEISAAFHPDRDGVRSYRLLGYSRMSGAESPELPTHLAAGAVHTVLLEIQARHDVDHFGSIVWSVNGKPAPSLVLAAKPASSSSDDARFAALVASYSLWLAGQTDALDGRVLSDLAEELRGHEKSDGRIDFLRLVDETAELSGR